MFFTVTFDQFSASLLNTIIKLLNKNLTDPKQLSSIVSLQHVWKDSAFLHFFSSDLCE